MNTMEAAKKIDAPSAELLEEEQYYLRCVDRILAKEPLDDDMSPEQKEEFMRQMRLACRVMAEHRDVLARLAE